MTSQHGEEKSDPFKQRLAEAMLPLSSPTPGLHDLLSRHYSDATLLGSIDVWRQRAEEAKQRALEEARQRSAEYLRTSLLLPLRRSMEILGSNGWALPGDLTLPQVKAAADAYEHHGPTVGDQWFCEYYRVGDGENMKSLRAKLSGPPFSLWQSVIEETLWAFDNHRYNLVVYASFPVLEAAVAEATGPEGTNAYRMWDRIGPGTETDICYLSIQTFLALAWERTDFTQSLTRPLNRHLALHRAKQIYDEPDALRLLTAIAAVGEYAQKHRAQSSQ